MSDTGRLLLVYILIVTILASAFGARFGSLRRKIMRKLLFFIQSISPLVSAVLFPLLIQSDTCDQVLWFFNQDEHGQQTPEIIPQLLAIGFLFFLQEIAYSYRTGIRNVFGSQSPD